MERNRARERLLAQVEEIIDRRWANSKPLSDKIQQVFNNDPATTRYRLLRRDGRYAQCMHCESDRSWIAQNLWIGGLQFACMHEVSLHGQKRFRQHIVRVDQLYDFEEVRLNTGIDSLAWNFNAPFLIGESEAGLFLCQSRVYLLNWVRACN